MFTSNLQKKIFYSYLVIMAVFILFITGISIYLLRREEEIYLRNMENVTVGISNQLETNLVNMNRICLQVCLNKAVYEAFEEIDKDGTEHSFEADSYLKKKLQEELLGIVGPDLSVGKVCVYSRGGAYLSYGKYYEKMGADYRDVLLERYRLMEEALREALSGKRVFMGAELFGDGKREIVTLVRFVKNVVNGRVVAVAETQLRVEELLKSIVPGMDGTARLYIYTDDGTLMYASDEGDGDSYFDNAGEGGSRRTQVRTRKNGGKELVSLAIGEKYGFQVVYVEEYSRMFQVIGSFVKIFIVLLLCICGASIAVLYRIADRLTAPLTELYSSLKKVRLNHMTVHLPEDSDIDIIHRLNLGFEEMFAELGILMENEIRANLKAMQAQMNPHFIYNMLSVISAASIEEKPDKVSFLCGELARLLRYSTSDGNCFVTLKDEIAHTECYCRLMKARYEEKLEYRITVRGEPDRTAMPKMILQPIVENCFKHGFARKEGICRIWIEAEAGEEGWYFSVTDNGTGIKDRAVENLNTIMESGGAGNSVSEMQEGGLGLKNTILRLRFSCKETIYYEIGSYDDWRSRKGAEALAEEVDRGTYVRIGGRKSD